MIQRRTFMALLGKGSAGTVLMPSLFLGCKNNNVTLPPYSDDQLNYLQQIDLIGIDPMATDSVELAKGLSYEILLKWGDRISSNDTFGFNNDFTCFIPLNNDGTDGLLWVNHEATDRLFVSNYKKGDIRTIEQVHKEMYSVGGSIIRIRKEKSKWTLVQNDPLNKRITAQTKIPLNWDTPIKDESIVVGTHSNCSGGITPWGTILTCEENYDDYCGETKYDENNEPYHVEGYVGWEEFYSYPPEHYGWVVEVDPLTGKAMKHVALGRFMHECCTLVELDDKRIVAYSGDDTVNECIYKFVSSKPASLKEGTLYVADTVNGKWISLDINEQPILKERFKDQTEVLIRAREAAKLVGGTPQNRPEDIEIDPLTGHVLIALTNNETTNDHHGSILKILESNDTYDALTFTSETLITGGVETGFSSPDNLIFDKAGNLWFTCDISESKMNSEKNPQYLPFKNNGLFVLIRHGEQAGEIIQIASAPFDAEFTGPWFSPDYKTLFLSVQHPGKKSDALDALTSTWPHDHDGIPKPSVVTIQGDLLDKLNNLDQLT